MAFSLPLPGSDAREAMGDVAHIVEVLNPANVGKLSTFRSAIMTAQRTLSASPTASRVNIICIRADDERWLISVGRRGGYRLVWNFGRGL